MNRFQQLVFLNRSHGWVLRGLCAALAFGVVFAVSGRVSLAHHAAQFWMNDQFALGAHVLRWHLSQGWTGRFLRQTPEFDISAVMNTQMQRDVVALLQNRVVRSRTASWGHSPQRDRFALLYFLGRQFHDTGNAAPYLAVANLISADLCLTPAPAVQQSKPNQFTKADAYDTLRAIGAMLDGIQTPWYLVSGTFLGAVREGDFLPHDYDIDVGVHIENLDADQLRQAVLAHPDLTLVDEDPYLHHTPAGALDMRHALFNVMHTCGIGVDIFVHHLDGAARWHGSTTHRWTNSDFDLAGYEIAGILVRGPADADLYLTENYGDWRVPVTVFNCSTGTPNVSFNHNLFSVSRLLYAATRAAPEFTDADAEIARMVLIQENYLTQTKTKWNFTIPWAL